MLKLCKARFIIKLFPIFFYALKKNKINNKKNKINNKQNGRQRILAKQSEISKKKVYTANMYLLCFSHDLPILM